MVRSLLFHNFELKLISITIAFLFWMIYVFSERPVTIRGTIDVVVEEVPEGLVVTSQSDTKIELELEGTAAQKKKFVFTDNPYRVNLSHVRAGKAFFNPWKDYKLPLGMAKIAMSPGEIGLELERKVKNKKIPIEARLEGSPAEGFEISKVEADPSSMRLTGAESEITQIQRVHTRPVDISDRKEDVTEEVEIDLSGFHFVEPKEKTVKVTVWIRKKVK